RQRRGPGCQPSDRMDGDHRSVHASVRHYDRRAGASARQVRSDRGGRQGPQRSGHRCGHGCSAWLSAGGQPRLGEKPADMAHVRYPSLYQINTRVWLNELSQSLGRHATLDDVPDGELDRLTHMGFDWVWLLSVWQTGQAGQKVSRSNPEWRKEFRETLPDLR